MLWYSLEMPDWGSSNELQKCVFLGKNRKNVYCRCSLEVPQWGTSNEYPQHVFMEKQEKYQYILIEKSALIGAYVSSPYLPENSLKI